MAGRHWLGISRVASVILLFLIARCQVIEPKPLEPAPIDRHSRAQNQQSNRAPAPVDLIALILSAKPRSTRPEAHKLDSQPSAKSIQLETPLIQSAHVNRKSNKTQPNKRQTDLLDHSNGSPSGTRSRRNEDPWFLDQAPLPLQPYRFVYNVKGSNGLTEQYRQEAGDGKFLTGSYGYVLPDGIYRHVDYVADDRGFRASIRTSEPGTANENPADVVINSNPVPQQAGPSYTSSASLVGSTGGAGGLNAFPNATSSWNYSGLPRGYAPIDVSRTSDAVSLARRPAGSIINTPLRNFNSLSYVQNPPPLPTLPNYSLTNFSTLPSAQVEPLPPLFESTRASSSPINNFNATQLQPTSWTISSWSDQKPTHNDAGSGQILNRISTPNSFYFPSQSSYGSFSAPAADRTSNSAANNFLDSTRDQSLSRNRNELSGTINTPSRVDSTLPSRAGPNLLLYDQPFASYPRENLRKIRYDSSYVYHPDSPFLSLERAKSIAQLDRFNSLSLGLSSIRPLDSRDSTNLLGQNGISQPDRSTNPASGLPSSSHSEQHHELHSSRQFVDSTTTGKSTLTKEHKSGHSTTFGQAEANLGSDKPLLPPKPQYQSALSWRVNQGHSPREPGVKGQSRGRLMAPYAGNLDQQQEQELQDDLSGVKGGQTSRHIETQYMQKTLDTFGSMAPTSPRPPEEARVEQPPSGNDNQKSPGATKSLMDSAERRMDEMELSRTTKSASDESKSAPTRTIRSKMAMSDIRSMQSSIGLPQPPRFQRSSLTSPIETILQPSRDDSANRANPTRPIETNVPSRLFNSFEGAQLKRTQLVDEQPRRLNGGRLDRSANNEELPHLASNETFEALRLSANKAQNLRLDKLSELKKFQERLRSQQKLLESIKSPIEAPAKQEPAIASRSPNETANSHVKYDEPNDYDSHNNVAANQVERSAMSPAGQSRTSNIVNSSPIENKLLHIYKLDLNGQTRVKEVHDNEIKSDSQVKKTDLRSPNTINLDFINSVTALSVDQSNPFAISSVNPAIQRNSERLSPHRLSLPEVVNSTSNSIRDQAARLLSSSDSSPVSTGSQERVRASGLPGSTLRIDATGSSSLLTNNHWLGPEDQAQVGRAHLLHEAANSQHKSFMATPIEASRQISSSGTNRDGFEIRDRSMAMDNHRFFEVVAN